jgi:hypothetical protein
MSLGLAGGDGFSDLEASFPRARLDLHKGEINALAVHDFAFGTHPSFASSSVNNFENTLRIRTSPLLDLSLTQINPAQNYLARSEGTHRGWPLFAPRPMMLDKQQWSRREQASLSAGYRDDESSRHGLSLKAA